jgi:hypothetical protein
MRNYSSEQWNTLEEKTLKKQPISFVIKINELISHSTQLFEKRKQVCFWWNNSYHLFILVCNNYFCKWKEKQVEEHLILINTNWKNHYFKLICDSLTYNHIRFVFKRSEVKWVLLHNYKTVWYYSKLLNLCPKHRKAGGQ